MYNESRLWNALSVCVRSEEDVDKFKKFVKKMLFDGFSELMRKVYKLLHLTGKQCERSAHLYRDASSTKMRSTN